MSFEKCTYLCRGFLGGSVVKNPPANAENAGDTGSIPGCGRSPGGRNGNPLQYSYLENPMDGGAWWAAVHGVTKRWIQLSEHACTLFNFSLSYCFEFRFLNGKESACSAETWVRSLGQEDPLEKGTTTPSSILAWRIPGTEEPGRLQSMGLQRVRHS